MEISQPRLVAPQALISQNPETRAHNAVGRYFRDDKHLMLVLNESLGLGMPGGLPIVGITYLGSFFPKRTIFVTNAATHRNYV